MKWTIYGIHLWQIVIIGGAGFFLGFLAAALLAAAGRADRETE
jgi:hypothetical protein